MIKSVVRFAKLSNPFFVLGVLVVLLFVVRSALLVGYVGPEIARPFGWDGVVLEALISGVPFMLGWLAGQEDARRKFMNEED